MNEGSSPLARMTPSIRSGHAVKWGMYACCAVMLLPVVGLVVAGDTRAGLFENAVVFAPVLLCVGMHLAMHKLMGRSCHDTQTETRQAAETDSAEGDQPSRPAA